MKKSNLRQQITQSLQDIFSVWRRETRSVFHDQGILIFFILVPLVYPLIYAFIYTNETLRDVPTAVVDLSQTTLSRQYLRQVDASPEVSLTAYCNDMTEAQEALKERKVYGIIYIPASFSDDIAQGRQTQVSLYCDMSGLLYYKSLVLANTEVSLEMNAAIKIARSGNTTERQDALTAYPIVYKDIALYNPTNGFAAFLIPAVLMLIIQQTLLLGIGLKAGTTYERNTLHNLVPTSRHRNGTLRIVTGKGLSYLMVYLLVTAYVLCIVPYIFRLNQLAIPHELALFLLPYLLACIFFSMTISVFIHSREACMPIFVFTSVPLLFLSGISWPGSAIPPFWRYVSYLFPSTFGINGFVRINSMGATLHEAGFELRALWIQTGVYFITACIVCKWQITQSRRRFIQTNRYTPQAKDDSKD